MPASIDWERIARAELHPLRIRILDLLDASSLPLSPVKLAEETGEPLGNCSYHVAKLVDRGLISLAETKPRRGAIEHLYVLEAKA